MTDWWAPLPILSLLSSIQIYIYPYLYTYHIFINFIYLCLCMIVYKTHTHNYLHIHLCSWSFQCIAACNGHFQLWTSTPATFERFKPIFHGLASDFSASTDANHGAGDRSLYLGPGHSGHCLVDMLLHIRTDFTFEDLYSQAGLLNTETSMNIKKYQYNQTIKA